MWRDFFYFSRSERKALIVLLCLITIAGACLILNGRQNTETKNAPANRQNMLPADTITTDKATNKQEYMKTDERKNTSPRQKSAKSNPQQAYNNTVKRNERKESIPDRANRIIASSRNASRPSYPRSEKFEAGTVIELNAADTMILKKVPGIGSAFANRIVKFRNLLGGFYSVNQLAEVYGMDEDRFNALKPWFTADASMIEKLNVNKLTLDELSKHPYINYRQAKAITQLRKQKGKLTDWESLQLLEEFTDIDEIRVLPYLSFE